MHQPRLTVRRRGLLAHVVLAALLLRAYIPVGFMPASGTPFLLELCPAAMSMPMQMPMPMPAGHHHDAGGHGHFDNCPFGSASAAGPITHVDAFKPVARIESQSIVSAERPAFGVRLERAHQPRGPPLLIA